jgi:hypothetical protein
MFVTVNRNYFSKQHQTLDHSSGEVWRFLRGTDKILKFCLDEFLLHRLIQDRMLCACVCVRVRACACASPAHGSFGPTFSATFVKSKLPDRGTVVLLAYKIFSPSLASVFLVVVPLFGSGVVCFTAQLGDARCSRCSTLLSYLCCQAYGGVA